MLGTVPVAHALDGCFERLDRGEAHLDAFKAACRESETEVNSRLTIKPDLDLKRNLLKAVVAEDARLPVRVGVIFGDVIHNLHAALDNLAFELGCLDGKTPGRASEFPILNEPNDWFTKRVERSLAFVRPQDRTRIESRQPFMRLDNRAPKDDVLARIKRYSNEGKHRVVTPIGGTAMGTLLEAVQPTDFRIVEADLDIQKALRKDAVIAKFAIEITGQNPKVSMKGSLRWYPSLDDGDPAEQFLTGALAYVRGLIDEFKINCF
jgi:hypothetical protein